MRISGNDPLRQLSQPTIDETTPTKPKQNIEEALNQRPISSDDAAVPILEPSHDYQQKQLAQSMKSELVISGSIQQKLIGGNFDQFVSPLQSLNQKSQTTLADASDAEEGMRQILGSGQTQNQVESQQVQFADFGAELQIGADFEQLQQPGAKLVSAPPTDPVTQQLIQKLQDLNTRKQELLAKLKELESQLAAVKVEPQSTISALLNLLGVGDKESGIANLQSQIGALKSELQNIDKEITATMQELGDISETNSQEVSDMQEMAADPMTSGQYTDDVQQTLTDDEAASTIMKRSNLLS